MKVWPLILTGLVILALYIICADVIAPAIHHLEHALDTTNGATR